MTTGNPYFDYTLLAVLVAACVVAVVVTFITAPYGRHEGKGKSFGFKLPTTLAWILMESPAVFLFFYWYVQGRNAAKLVPMVLCGLWMLHYVHRTLIYPFTLQHGPNEGIPFWVVLFGFIFNAANAFLNASFLSEYGEHLTSAWLLDPRFALGAVVFALGFAINKHSDYVLRELGKASKGEYVVPHGGAFKWVSMPNYFGEILTWIGFSIAAWSPAGLVFVLFTMANLVPRAVSNHRWYKEKFADYPPHRKAVFPYIL